MTTIAKGNVDQFSVYAESPVLFTPGSGGHIKFGCSSPDGVTRPVDRTIYAAETITIPAGSTVFVEAIGADGAYSITKVAATYATTTAATAAATAYQGAGVTLVDEDGAQWAWSGSVYERGAGGGGGSVAPIQVTESRALTESDNGAVLYSTSASNFTLTIPSGLPSGFWCTLSQLGSGVLAPAAGSGVTLTNSGATTGENTFLGVAQTSAANTYTLALPQSPSPYAYTGNWAGLIAMSTVGLTANVSQALVTNVPISGGSTIFVWDGTYWRPQGGRCTLYTLGASLTATFAAGVGTEQQVLSVPIPAKLLPPNARLRWSLACDKTGTTTLTGSAASRFGFTNSASDGNMSSLTLTTTQVTGGGVNEAQRTSATQVSKSGAGQANQNSPATSTSTTTRNGAVNVADLDASTNYFTIGLAMSGSPAGGETMVLHNLILEVFA